MAASDNDGAEPTHKSNRSTAALIGAAVAAGLSCLATPVAGVVGAAAVFVIGALGVLLAPLVALILLFGGGGSADPVRAADDSLAAAQGDGKGALDPEQVPEGLADSIEEAGKTCPQIGPVVIAAQIEVASGWDPAKVGANGEKGISNSHRRSSRGTARTPTTTATPTRPTRRTRSPHRPLTSARWPDRPRPCWTTARRSARCSI